MKSSPHVSLGSVVANRVGRYRDRRPPIRQRAGLFSARMRRDSGHDGQRQLSRRLRQPASSAYAL